MSQSQEGCSGSTIKFPPETEGVVTMSVLFIKKAKGMALCQTRALLLKILVAVRIFLRLPGVGPLCFLSFLAVRLRLRDKFQPIDNERK